MIEVNELTERLNECEALLTEYQTHKNRASNVAKLKDQGFLVDIHISAQALTDKIHLTGVAARIIHDLLESLVNAELTTVQSALLAKIKELKADAT